MNIEIRQAAPADAPSISAIKQAVWPSESPKNQAYIADVIALPDHATHLAFVEGTPAGFVDGFMTYTLEGLPRWEVDLLAVHPDFRGKGIAAQLVALSTETGKARGANFARGLVEIENIASQRTFARCGYTLEDEHHALMVGSELLIDVLILPPENTLLTAVQTINYRGIWIEGAYQKNSFLAGQVLCTQHAWDLTGAVIPNSDTTALQIAQELEFTLIGHYQWWKRSLV